MKYLLLLVALFILIPEGLSSDDEQNVCFTKEEAEKICERLEKDKKIIRWQSKRWKDLINAKPKVYYKTTDKNTVIQKIEIPVKKDKPLIYKIELEVKGLVEKPTFFPLNINLGIIIESGAVRFRYVDPKIGLQIFGLKPIKLSFIQGLGLHVLVGVQSAGLSLSWGWMKKPIKNLRFHFYGGITYEGEKTFGGGITLDF